jgi:hypothetical protein
MAVQQGILGNFAILGRRELIPEQEIAALQPLLE